MVSPPENGFSLASLVKNCLLVSSLVALGVALGYWHPLVVPVFTHTMPQHWSVLQSWFTAPVLFVLMNLVVGAVYFTSVRVHRHPRAVEADAAAEETDPSEAADRVGDVPEGRFGKFSVRERLPRIVRSKSDQLVLPKPAELTASPLKKFASGTETGNRSKAHEGVSTEDDPALEEVNKKAEDFIGSFYQRLKLQRLDSLTKYQGWINRSHGPP